MSGVWKDITSQLASAAKSFKLFEIACPNDYNLEDSMQATQMNDEKVDVKTHLVPGFTLRRLIEDKKVRKPEELKLEDMVAVWDYVAGFEVMYMKQTPLPQSIYTLTYLYDREVAKRNEYLLGLVDSVNSFGSYFQAILRQSLTIRDDDNTFSFFGFSKDKSKTLGYLESHDEIVEDLLKLQKQLENHSKTNKDQQKVANALNLRIKSRRFLHLLLKEMGDSFETKKADKIKKVVQSYRKRIDDIIQSFEISAKPEGVFNDDIYKTLRTQLSPRQVKYPEIKQTYGELKNMVNQIDMFLPVPPTFSQILERVDELLSLPLNKLSKAYIVSMFFKPKADYLDTAIPLADAIAKDIVDYLSLKQNILKSEKFQQLSTQIATFMNQILLKMFLNKPRWQWQASKIYENFNYIVHLSNEFQGQKDMQLISYSYSLGINQMIKQIQMGLQIDLYYPEEYGYIFYYTEYLLNIANRNAGVFIKKFDKGYIDAFDQKTLSNKIKKKVTSNMRKMFSSIIFYKGMHLYYNSMYRLLFLLINDNVITVSKHQKQRFVSRFQIFRKVLFIKPADYDSYQQQLKRTGQNREENIKMIESNLKQAKELFGKLSSLEQSDIFSHTRNQLSGLTVLCVRQSLQVMKYKMSKEPIKKVNFSKTSPHYIEVNIS